MKKSSTAIKIISGSIIGGVTAGIFFIPEVLLIAFGLTFFLFNVLNINGYSNLEDFLGIYFYWLPAIGVGLIGGLIGASIHIKQSSWAIVFLKSCLGGLTGALIVAFLLTGRVIKGWIEASDPYENVNIKAVPTEQPISLLSGSFQEMAKVNGNVDSFEISTDGQLLAYSLGDQIILWNLGNNTEKVRLSPGYKGKISDLAFSSDGRWLVSGGFDQKVIIWSLSTGEVVHILQGHQTDQIYVGVSPDNELVASGDNEGHVILWDLQTGQEIKRLESGSSQLHCLDFSPDGKYLAACTDYPDGIFLWDLEKYEPVGRLALSNQWNGTIHGMDFSPNGQLVAGAALFGPLLWNPVVKPYPVGTFKDIVTGNRIDFSPDGRQIVSTSQAGIYLWEVSSREPVGKLEDPTASKAEALFLSNKKLLAIYWDKNPLDDNPAALTTRIGIWSVDNR